MEIKFDRRDFYLIALVILMFVIGAYLYPKFPDKVPTHGGPTGEADEYEPKTTGLFVFPVMALVLYFILTLIPYVEVYQKNLMSFYPYYYGLKVIILLFMFVMYIATRLPNFGISFNMNHFILPLFALLFFYVGDIMKNFKRNFFVGLRTPWTLSDDRVWKRTHEKGGVVFKIMALFAIFGIFLKEYAIWFIVIPAGVGIAYLVIYSYILYRKIGRKR